MQISSINNFSFQGRQEVLYGLKKAAESANSLAADLGKSNKVNYDCFSELHAYADMVTHDSAFLKTIKDMPEDFIKELKKALKPEETPYSVKAFCSSIFSKAKTHNKTNNDTITNFVSQIKK